MRQKKEENVEIFKEKLILRRKKLLSFAIVLAFAILFILGLYVYNLKNESDAKELEAKAYKYYFGNIKNQNLPQEQRFLESAKLFMEAYHKKKNYTYLLNAGYAYDMAGQKEKAIEVLNKVENSKDLNMANLAKIKIAMIYMRNNDTSKAISKFNEIINDHSPIMKDFAIYQLAKIYEKDNKEESLRYYEKLVKEFPQSPFNELAKNELEKK